MRKKRNAPQAALERAIVAAGGLSSLARRMGVVPQLIHNWRVRGNVPPERVLAIEAAIRDERGDPVVRRHELRPDVYPEVIELS